jgi:hypothetical protein
MRCSPTAQSPDTPERARPQVFAVGRKLAPTFEGARDDRMRGPKRFLWLALATAMVAPGKARARGRRYASLPTPPRQNQGRRVGPRAPQTLAPSASPGGRHVVHVAGGAVFVDGRRVHPRDGSVYLLAAPSWRADGGAVAWIERGDGETRLVVLPAVDDGAAPLPWVLPALPGGDQLFWAGRNRIVVGPALLAPRAVASWSP